MLSLRARPAKFGAAPLGSVPYWWTGALSIFEREKCGVGSRQVLPFIKGDLPSLGTGGVAMNSSTVHRLSLQFDAGQITPGRPEEQAAQAIALINAVLQREPFGLAASTQEVGGGLRRIAA